MCKVAIVFGGSGAIGREVCNRLVDLGYKTYFSFLSNEEIAKTMELKNEGKLYGLKCNICNNEEIKSFVSLVEEQNGRVDVLINCVGISRESLFVNKSIEDWRAVIETNLFSVFYACKAVVPIMLEQYSGVILNVSSILGVFGIPGMVDYCASKSALIGFSQSLAAEVARFGVRVNSISPGMIDTEMSKGAQQQIGKSVKRLIPGKEFGTAENVADLIEFLISSKSSYINGENILIGGGLGRSFPVS